MSKSYGNSPTLKKISLHFDYKGVIGLLGPNGAGKTSLIRILTGYLNQWDGEITFDGLDLRNDLKKIQRQIGYLPENNPLYPEMYVREYLSYVGQLYQIKNPPVAEVIEKTGLEAHASKKIGILSKGYQQRLGLAATLLPGDNSFTMMHRFFSKLMGRSRQWNQVLEALLINIQIYLVLK